MGIRVGYEREKCRVCGKIGLPLSDPWGRCRECRRETCEVCKKSFIPKKFVQKAGKCARCMSRYRNKASHAESGALHVD